MGALATAAGTHFEKSTGRIVGRQWRLFRKTNGEFLAREYAHHADPDTSHVGEAVFTFCGSQMEDENNALAFKMLTGFDPMKFVI